MMNPARIAVIGCGYLGSALVERLLADGLDCVATTTHAEKVASIQQLGASPVVLKLSDAALLHETVRDREIVYLTVAAGRSADYREVYLEGARNLMTAVADTAVRRIIYTSSTSVYGQNDGSRVDEDSPTESTTENGRLLVETERCLLAESKSLGITATVLRLGGLHGPGRDPAERMSQYAGTQRDDGDVYINLIQRDDAVEAMMQLLNVEYDGVLNLCDDKPITRRDYYDRLVASAQLPAIQWTTNHQRAPTGKRVSATRIRTLIHRSPLWQIR